ncbi:hypothetical protein [Streptomyces sp. NPDC002265]|uniref:hypothetical protein n=1 Tax=Streptomyces sp. NPDC002265 TaxID=3154415 RepID=UPI00332196C4
MLLDSLTVEDFDQYMAHVNKVGKVFRQALENPPRELERGQVLKALTSVGSQKIMKLADKPWALEALILHRHELISVPRPLSHKDLGAFVRKVLERSKLQPTLENCVELAEAVLHGLFPAGIRPATALDDRHVTSDRPEHRLAYGGTSTPVASMQDIVGPLGQAPVGSVAVLLEQKANNLGHVSLYMNLGTEITTGQPKIAHIDPQRIPTPYVEIYEEPTTDEIFQTTRQPQTLPGHRPIRAGRGTRMIIIDGTRRTIDGSGLATDTAALLLPPQSDHPAQVQLSAPTSTGYGMLGMELETDFQVLTNVKELASSSSLRLVADLAPDGRKIVEIATEPMRVHSKETAGRDRDEVFSAAEQILLKLSNIPSGRQQRLSEVFPEADGFTATAPDAVVVGKKDPQWSEEKLSIHFTAGVPLSGLLEFLSLTEKTGRARTVNPVVRIAMNNLKHGLEFGSRTGIEFVDFVKEVEGFPEGDRFLNNEANILAGYTALVYTHLAAALRHYYADATNPEQEAVRKNFTPVVSRTWPSTICASFSSRIRDYLILKSNDIVRAMEDHFAALNRAASFVLNAKIEKLENQSLIDVLPIADEGQTLREYLDDALNPARESEPINPEEAFDGVTSFREIDRTGAGIDLILLELRFFGAESRPELRNVRKYYEQIASHLRLLYDREIASLTQVIEEFSATEFQPESVRPEDLRNVVDIALQEALGQFGLTRHQFTQNPTLIGCIPLAKAVIKNLYPANRTAVEALLPNDFPDTLSRAALLGKAPGTASHTGWAQVSDLEAVTAALIEAGNGASAIVLVERSTGIGHAFAATSTASGVFWVDLQASDNITLQAPSHAFTRARAAVFDPNGLVIENALLQRLSATDTQTAAGSKTQYNTQVRFAFTQNGHTDVLSEQLLKEYQRKNLTPGTEAYARVDDVLLTHFRSGQQDAETQKGPSSASAGTGGKQLDPKQALIARLETQLQTWLPQGSQRNAPPQFTAPSAVESLSPTETTSSTVPPTPVETPPPAPVAANSRSAAPGTSSTLDGADVEKIPEAPGIAWGGAWQNLPVKPIRHRIPFSVPSLLGDKYTMARFAELVLQPLAMGNEQQQEPAGLVNEELRDLVRQSAEHVRNHLHALSAHRDGATGVIWSMSNSDFLITNTGNPRAGLVFAQLLANELDHRVMVEIPSGGHIPVCAQ